MYKRIVFDRHKIWWPRWGHSKKQIQEARKLAREYLEEINWD